MSQQSALRQWAEESRKSMPRLSKPQAKALAAFSAGIAKAEGRGLSAAAEKLPFAGSPAAVERGIQRFIANDGIDCAESRRATARRSVGSLPEDKPVALLVDETGLKDRLEAMVVAVTFKRNAYGAATARSRGFWRRAVRSRRAWGMGFARGQS